MPECSEIHHMTCAINEGWDRFNISNSITSSIFHPKRIKNTTTSIEIQYFKDRPDLEWLTKTAHRFEGCAKRNAEMALVFFSLETKEYVAINFRLAIGAFWEWVHATDFDKIEPLFAATQRLNLAFSFTGCEYLLVLFDCSQSKNFAEWSKDPIPLQLPLNIHVPTSYNYKGFNAAFQSSVPDSITDPDAYTKHVYLAIKETSLDRKPLCQCLSNQNIFGTGIGGYSRPEILDRLYNTYPHIHAGLPWKEVVEKQYYIELIGIYLQFLQDNIKISGPYLPLQHDSRLRKRFECSFLQVYGKPTTVKAMPVQELGHKGAKDFIYTTPSHVENSDNFLLEQTGKVFQLRSTGLGVGAQSWHSVANFSSAIFDPSKPNTSQFKPVTYSMQPDLEHIRKTLVTKNNVLPSFAPPNITQPKIPKTSFPSSQPTSTLHNQPIPFYTQTPFPTQPLYPSSTSFQSTPKIALSAEEQKALAAVIKSGLLQPRKKAKPNAINRMKKKQATGKYGAQKIEQVRKVIAKIDKEKLLDFKTHLNIVSTVKKPKK